MRRLISPRLGIKHRVTGSWQVFSRQIKGILDFWLGTSLVWRVVLWLCLGIVLGKHLDLPPHLTWLATLVWWIVCCFRARLRPKGLGRAPLIILLVMAGATSLCVNWSQVGNNQGWLVETNGEIPVFARVREVSSGTPVQRTLIVEIRGILAPAGVWRDGGLARITQVALPEEGLGELRPGDGVVVRARFQRPRRAGNPGQFDYGHYLRRRGIGVVAYVEGNSPIQKITTEDVGRLLPHGVDIGGGRVRFALLRSAETIRQTLLEVWRDHLPERTRGLLAAMVFGDKGLLLPDIQEAFRRTGQAHLLSVSGLHIGFVAAAVWFLLKVLRWGEVCSGIITVLVVWAYALIAGWNLPVIRAATTLTIYLVALGLGRGHDRLAATGWAALIQLFFNPSLLFETSFQLSYGALLGILNMGPIVRHTCSFNWQSNTLPGKVAARAVDLLILSLSAQLALFPLMAYYFHEFAWVGLILGLVTIPLASLIVPLGLLGSVAGLWGPLLGFLAAMICLPLEALDHIVSQCGVWSWVRLHMAAGSPMLWLSYYLVLTLTMQQLNRAVLRRWLGMEMAMGTRLRKCWIHGVLVCVLLMVYYPILSQWWRPLEIVFLDVGQGDAIFVSTPSGHTMLVDGGGRPPSLSDSSFDIGEDIVLPFLRHRGIRHLDVVVATHMHNDHTQGLGAVLRELPVNTLADNGLLDAGFASQQYQRVLREAKIEGRTPRKILRRGHHFALGPRVQVMVLYPTGDPHGSISRSVLDQNNNSVVLKLQTAHYAILLTGDIDKQAQLHLLELNKLLGKATAGAGQGEPNQPNLGFVQDRFELKAHILKVPHHGSREALVYSFLGEVSPTEGVISVGSNPFGHPAEGFLHALEIVTGKPPWRTDQMGSIRVRIWGRHIRIHGYHAEPFWSVGTWPIIRQWESQVSQVFSRVWP